MNFGSLSRFKISLRIPAINPLTALLSVLLSRRIETQSLRQVCRAYGFEGLSSLTEAQADDCGLLFLFVQQQSAAGQPIHLLPFLFALTIYAVAAPSKANIINNAIIFFMLPHLPFRLY